MAIPSSMPPDTAIQVVDLGKRYHIGLRETANKTLSEVIMDTVKRPVRIAKALRRGDRALQTERDTFWALRDVSFDVKRGEVVGVIGRNGAGKSTLLKVLTRITNPDEGYARIRGRVGSLLEVGTGFHGELTGRENIYLNGAILGMQREEIDQRFDAIVAFSGVERFIDTPVKRYSSGMYLRLAFSVAAHLEPDILLVDEVLAVGDAAFQKKSMGKMGDVAQSGRTVLLVSHNMAAISNLCTNAILIDQGHIVFHGPVDQAVQRYAEMAETSEMSANGALDLSAHPARRAGSKPILKQIRLLDRDGVPRQQVHCGDMLQIELTIDTPDVLSNPQFGIGVDNSVGTRVFSLLTRVTKTDIPPELHGMHTIICEIPELPLVPDRYRLSLSVGVNHQPLLDGIEHAVSLDVIEGDFFGTGKLPPSNLGSALVRSSWREVDG